MSRSLFRKRFFSVLCTGLALAVLFIWSSVWTDLREYEQGSEENVVARFVEELKAAAEADVPPGPQADDAAAEMDAEGGEEAKQADESGSLDQTGEAAAQTGGEAASAAADTGAVQSVNEAPSAVEGEAAADSGEPDASVQPAGEGSCARLLKDSGYDGRIVSAEVAGAYLAQLCSGKELSWEQVCMQAAVEGGDPIPVPGLYDIFADGKPVAELTVETSGRYGLLDLERLSVSSVKGLERYEIAVASPERYDLFNASFLKMSPIRTGYIYKDLIGLSQSTVDVKVPEYYVYELTDAFGAPMVYRSQIPDEPYPLVKMGGVYFVNNHALMELEDDFDAMASARTLEICQLLTGELKWENLRGSILTTAPLLAELEGREGELNARQTLTEYSEPLLTEHYIWHENLISVRAQEEMILHTPDGDRREELDCVLYFSRTDNDSDWTLCEMAEQGK